MKQLSLWLQMLRIPFNPYCWDNTCKRVHSDLLTLDLKDDKGKTINVSRLSNDVSIQIPLKNSSSDIEYQHFFIKNGASRFHEINVDFENETIQLQVRPEDEAVKLMIFMRFGYRPTSQEHDLNGTVSRTEWCIWTRLRRRMKWRRNCSSNGLTPIQVFVQKPGKYYVEVLRHENFAFYQKRQRSCMEVKRPPPTPPQKVRGVPTYDPCTDHNYTMRVAMGSCVYWSAERQMWTTEGCKVITTGQGYHTAVK